MECLLNPDCEANLRERERQQWLLEESRKREEIERQNEEERQREFQKRKAGLLDQMKGQAGTLQMRDVSSLPELKVREVDGTFATKTLKPRDLSSPAPAASLSSAPTTTLQKTQCAAYLLRKASQAASDGKFEESAYLSNEAAELMSGAKKSPGVVCPAPPEVPSVEGGPIAESREQAEKLQKMAFVYSKLYSQAAQQVGDYRVVLTTVKRAEEKVDNTKLKREEAKNKVDRLQTQAGQQPNAASTSAMAQALAALQQADAVLRETEKDLADATKEKEEMEKKMNQTRELFVQARDNPEKVDALFKDLSPRSQGETEK
jgi:hypothetical protein